MYECYVCDSRTRSFDSADIKACHWMRPWASFVQLAFSQPISQRPILILLYFYLFRVDVFELDFTTSFVCISCPFPSQILASAYRSLFKPPSLCSRPVLRFLLKPSFLGFRISWSFCVVTLVIYIVCKLQWLGFCQFLNSFSNIC